MAVLIFVASGMAGLLGRNRRAYLEEAEARAARAEAQRDRESARAAAAERARIARELHDVVAHHVSLMAVQAEAAASLLPGRPAQARQSVEMIGDTARQALAELRRLLGVLRGPAEEIETEPSPSLSELGAVLDQVRAAGLPVEFRTGGQPAALAPGVELTAYRIVQEALTNTLRHAPASQAVVTLAYEPDFITVTVANSGPAAPALAAMPAAGPDRVPAQAAAPSQRSAVPGRRTGPVPGAAAGPGRARPGSVAGLRRAVCGCGPAAGGGRRPARGGSRGGRRPGRVRAGRHRRAGRVLRREPVRRARPGRRVRGDRPAAGPVTAAVTSSGPPGPIRVLVADDQELVRSGFCVILDAADGITVVGEAANGRLAVAGAAEQQPDVVLMDVRMPEMDGLEATRLITGGAGPRPKVVMLTTFDLDDYVYDALRAGASGFLLKDAPRHDLIAAVRAAAAGNALLAPTVTRRLIERFARLPAELAPAPSQLAALTARERDILLLVARGRSNAEIAAALFLSEATVKTHIGHVLAKLGLRDRVQAVILAYEAGIVVPGEHPGA